MKRMTIKDYANKEGVSITTVYKRINKGFINTVKEGRNVFIVVKDNFIEEPTKNPEEKKPEKEAVLKKEIEYLKMQVEDLKKDKEEANQEKENLLKTVFLSQQTIQRLEYKQQEENEEITQLKKELEEEKNKTWWQKILGK